MRRARARAGRGSLRTWWPGLSRPATRKRRRPLARDEGQGPPRARGFLSFFSVGFVALRAARGWSATRPAPPPDAGKSCYRPARATAPCTGRSIYARDGSGCTVYRVPNASCGRKPRPRTYARVAHAGLLDYIASIGWLHCVHGRRNAKRLPRVRAERLHCMHGRHTGVHFSMRPVIYFSSVR